MRIRLQVAMGKSQPRAGASRTGLVTLARLQSSALREWDRLVGALETARRDPRRLGPWAVQVVRFAARVVFVARSEEHTSELQSQSNLVCRLLLEKKKKIEYDMTSLTLQT